MVLSKIFKSGKTDGRTSKEQKWTGAAQQIMVYDTFSQRSRSLLELNTACMDNSGWFWNKCQCSPNRPVEDSCLPQFCLVLEESLSLNEGWLDVNFKAECGSIDRMLQGNCHLIHHTLSEKKTNSCLFRILSCLQNNTWKSYSMDCAAGSDMGCLAEEGFD